MFAGGYLGRILGNLSTGHHVEQENEVLKWLEGTRAWPV
jgi:hypothetical protein